MTVDHIADDRRLEALASLDILDTPRELAFDRITALCRKIFQVPIATLSFVDGHRQWLKSFEGLVPREADRRAAFCNYAIQQDEPLVIPDTCLDPRFADNPFVASEPFIRFYAGAQLSISGVTIGMICVIDTKPRKFAPESIAILQDLAAIVVDELRLRNLSMQDSLTGLLSRRAFRAEGDRLTALANRHNHDLTCAVLDVDHFKSVNDRFGHAIGDAVLTKVAEICRQSVRSSDVIGRIGGEEFGVLLPHTNLDSGMVVLEKIRAAIAATPVATSIGPVEITCSLAGASRLSGQHFDAALHNADLAMYAAKQAGRNRALPWRDTTPPLSPSLRRVLKFGQITFNAGRSTYDCTVRALSDEAATLDVFSSVGIPDQFKLSIASEGVSRQCQSLAKTNTRIEIAFI